MNEQRKAEITSAFQASGTVRARLTELLHEKRLAAEKKRLSEDGYASPNWAYMQADINGFNRAIEEILSLIE